MINFETITEEEIKIIEEKRAESLGQWFCETLDDNIIIKELRLNYGFLYLYPNLISEQGKLELQFDEKRKIMHLAFIGIAENIRKQGFGTEMMNNLLRLTDKHGYDVDLHVAAKFGVAKKVIVKFYKKFGFEATVFGTDSLLRKRKES
jgi:GNAT superfamily N-acetyltransferase